MMLKAHIHTWELMKPKCVKMFIFEMKNPSVVLKMQIDCFRTKIVFVTAMIGAITTIGTFTLDLFGKIQLYKPLLAPHLEYCTTIYFLTTETQMRRL